MICHYIDITLLPDAEFPAHQLLSVLYSKLHHALVQLKTNELGVSFPGYVERPATLGTTLRVFGSEYALVRLMSLPWLLSMRDYILVTQINPVPSSALHRHLNRVQAKSSPERLRRRHMKRHGINEEQAILRVPDDAIEKLKLPFITLQSASTEQKFRLFLRLGPSEAAPLVGSFNTYGLSTTATVPYF